MALYYIAAFTAVRALPSAFDRARSAEKDFDVLRRTGGSDGPRILFVGGNPGVARFYAAAAQELADATRGDVAVLGLRGFVDGRRVSRGWWGDATRWALHRPRGPFSVAEQIAHVADHIDGERALAEGQGRQLVVVGHSIGRCRNQFKRDRPSLRHPRHRRDAGRFHHRYRWLLRAQSTKGRARNLRDALPREQRGRPRLPKT